MLRLIVNYYLLKRKQFNLTQNPPKINSQKCYNKTTMKIIQKNKKAFFDYRIKETFEAGVALLGHEVKSVKGGDISLKGSFVTLNQGEIWLLNANIPLYKHATDKKYDPRRTRKLLLHRNEIERLIGKVQEKGTTLIPIKIYVKRGRIKVEVGIGEGKKKHDKRQAIKEQEDKRKIERAVRKK
ncbi:SsrA-binding protein SmpB [Patescibacteria group bacterium]